MPAGIYMEEWSPEYGSPYGVEATVATPATNVELVEDGDTVQNHPGTPTALNLAFIDGIRRGEGHLYQTAPDGTMTTGLAGVYAVGSVLLENGEAHFGDAIVKRLLIWSDGVAGELPNSDLWQWEPLTITEQGTPALIETLQDAMRHAEAELGQSLRNAGRLVVLDGPLTYMWGQREGSVGYIKTHHRSLLPTANWPQVADLPLGYRTSLFSINQDRYSCYARVGNPTLVGGPYTGIIRLEIPADSGLAHAVLLANQMTGILPELAGRHVKDPRAPQNLDPVHSLENHLRHALGDSRLATRALRDAVAQKLQIPGVFA